MECTVWVAADSTPFGWPTDAQCSGDEPIVLTGVSAILWRARTRGSTDRQHFDRAAGAVLADRLEEYPEENDNPRLAGLMAGYLRQHLLNPSH